MLENENNELQKQEVEVYAFVDSENKCLRWYIPTIHKDIPDGCIETTFDAMDKAIELGANSYVDGSFVFKEQRTDTEVRKAEYISKLMDINAEYDLAISNLSRGVPDTERSTWTKQEQEAKEVIAGNINVPMLSALATARGIPLEYLASKVIEKASLYATIVGQLTGIRQREEDALKLEYKDIL